MDESTQHEPRDVTSLSRKSWTAYVWPIVLPLLALALTLPPAWQHGWTTAVACGAVILAISAYVIWNLRAVHLHWDDVGVWVYSGVLPWNKGVAGVKWRDLDEAVMTINSRHQEPIRSGQLM